MESAVGTGDGVFTWDPSTGVISYTGAGSTKPGTGFSGMVDSKGNLIPQWMIDLYGTKNAGSYSAASDPTQNAQNEADALSGVLGIPGLPSDLENQILGIYKQYPNNPQLAAQLAMEAIRGSDWYGQNYAGIQAGEAAGVIGNEADYRSYMNQANQMYQQYYGRAITKDEMSSLLTQGINLPTLNKQLDAAQKFGAMNMANPAVASMFSQDEMQQIANTEAGLGSQNGQYLLALYQFAAQAAPLYMQYGVKFDRTGLEQAFQSGTSPDTLGRQFAGDAFVSANKDQLAYAVGAFGDKSKLTPDELQAYGREQAGLDTPLGQRINNIVQMAQKRMQGIFSGNLATPNLSVSSSGKVGSSTLGVPTDVGA